MCIFIEQHLGTAEMFSVGATVADCIANRQGKATDSGNAGRRRKRLSEITLNNDLV